MQKIFAIVILVLGFSGAWAESIEYNSNYAAAYAYKNYDQSKQVKFAKYSNNCTNFVSQAILAGFARTTSMITLYNKRKQFLADMNDDYSWYYIDKYDKGNTWSEAHSLYIYAKFTDEKDNGPNYLYKGPKFKKITNDDSKHYMKYNEVKVGDIIFMDWHDEYFEEHWDDMYDSNGNLTFLGKKHARPDGKMDHTLIVTKFQWWRRGYNKIRVASNSSDYKDKGLGTINEKYDKKAFFYVYRPIEYTK